MPYNLREYELGLHLYTVTMTRAEPNTLIGIVFILFYLKFQQFVLHFVILDEFVLGWLALEDKLYRMGHPGFKKRAAYIKHLKSEYTSLTT